MWQAINWTDDDHDVWRYRSQWMHYSAASYQEIFRTIIDYKIGNEFL